MKISNFKDIDPASISNIIFDWGGVITELDFDRMSKGFADLGINDFRSYFSKYEQKDFLKEFEMGLITDEEFRTEVQKFCMEGTSFFQIDEAWNSILSITPPERITLLEKLAEKFNLYLLSNTNEIHTKYYNAILKKEFKTDHFKLFKKVYYSNKLGMRKPGIEIFKQVLNDGGMIPGKTLFIDDTEVNITPAAELGIISFHLDSGMEISELFKDWL